MKRRTSYSPIGIEVSARWINAAQIRAASDARRLHAAVRLARLPGATLEAEAERLAGVLERRGFEGDRVVLGAPQEMIVSTVLELPPRASGAPIEQLAVSELGRMNKREGVPMEVVLWEIPAASRASSACEYMAAACPHDAATAFLDAFERAGLEVAALDITQLALLRACAPALHAAPAMDAILNMGWDRCSILIVTDGLIVYERALEGAEGRTLVTNASERLGLAPDAVEDLLCGRREADGGAELRELQAELRGLTTSHVASLIEQVRTSFSYVGRRYSDRDLVGLVLTGDFAALDGLAPRIVSLGVQAHVAAAADIAAPLIESAPDPGPSVIAALGLAIHPDRSAA